MTLRTIVTGKDQKILRTKCQPVQNFDDTLESLVNDMVETMIGPQDAEISGIGIAAPQVGIDARIFIVTLGLYSKKKNKYIAMINPEIIEFSDHTIVLEEGCLSLPNQFGNVRRPSKIKVRWQNIRGEWCERKFDGWDSRIIQHENDHIDGVLFIDKLEG